MLATLHGQGNRVNAPESIGDGSFRPLRGGQICLCTSPRIPSATADSILGYFRPSLREEPQDWICYIQRKNQL
jgi:hypothetical protein